MNEIPKDKGLRIYISGPISGTSDAWIRFEAAARRISMNGNIPVNPEPIGRLVMPKAGDLEYMTIDLLVLEFTDAIYMLRGWEDSKGARMELMKAKAHNMPVFYEEESNGADDRFCDRGVIRITDGGVLDRGEG